MFKVALVGKPNVGKSSLFNRITAKKTSIVDDQPGVTRDRIYGEALWLNKNFSLIDTGGLTNKNVSYQKNIETQVLCAIEEADLILFVCSNKEGINAEDHFVAKTLKKFNKNKKILLVLNKAENGIDDQIEKQAYSFGYGKPQLISAEHGIGIGDLLEKIIDQFKNNSEKKENKNFTFCIVGKPNTGKSTLTNTILNEERVIVSEEQGTTRDSIDCDFRYNNQEYTLIDTAGIRRKGKIVDNIEKYSVLRTEQAIGRSQLVVLMIDGSQEISEQDEIVGGLAYDSQLPTIICINKWDAIKKDTNTMDQFKKKIQSRFKFLSWAPIIFISAKNNSRIQTLFETIEKIREQIDLKVSTSALHQVIMKSQIFNPPPKFKGRRFIYSYSTQVKSNHPTFVIFGNDPKYVHFSYARFIENEIRNAFGITNVPITLYFKDKNSRIRGSVEER